MKTCGCKNPRVETRKERPKGYIRCKLCKRIVGFRGKFY